MQLTKELENGLQLANFCSSSWFSVGGLERVGVGDNASSMLPKVLTDLFLEALFPWYSSKVHTMAKSRNLLSFLVTFPGLVLSS